MIIKNGIVFQEDGTFAAGDIYIRGARLVDSKDETTDSEVLDASGMVVLPGLVDIHSHGAAGHDFSDADVDGLRQILCYEAKHGITSYCPTSMTLPKEQLIAVFRTAQEIQKYPEAEVLAGVNMEGPFIDPKKKGAQAEENIVAPDVGFFRECVRASGGRIKLVTLAPNMPGSVDFIRTVSGEAVISVGHTTADYETALEAMKSGAHHVTHLYNAMPSFSHRAPGVIGAAFDDPDCRMELICDGYHVHPSVVRATFRMMGAGRMILISDSMMATGMPDGSYTLGGQRVLMKNKKATLSDGVTIAGSSTNLFDCMRNAISFGVPAKDAILAASKNPAKSIGMDGEIGSISPGRRADLLLTDRQFNLKRVILAGKVIL